MASDRSPASTSDSSVIPTALRSAAGFSLANLVFGDHRLLWMALALAVGVVVGRRVPGWSGGGRQCPAAGARLPRSVAFRQA